MGEASLPSATLTVAFVPPKLTTHFLPRHFSTDGLGLLSFICLRDVRYGFNPNQLPRKHQEGMLAIESTRLSVDADGSSELLSQHFK